MTKWPSKVKKGSVVYITGQEHDHGLIVCQNYASMVSEDEYIAINRLCMAYGNNEGLDADFYHKAMGAIRRVQGSTVARGS